METINIYFDNDTEQYAYDAVEDGYTLHGVIEQDIYSRDTMFDALDNLCDDLGVCLEDGCFTVTAESAKWERI